MDSNLWAENPLAAFSQWQHEEAVGAGRKAFSEQTIVQHCSMFGRFNSFLTERRVALNSFGTDHIADFFASLAHECQPGTTTRLRYLKLIDRLSRHLVAHAIRTDNPAGSLLAGERWPEDEPVPVYISADEDACLQKRCVPREFETFKDLRNVSVVAMFLASGITVAELQKMTIGDCEFEGARPSIFINKYGPRIARRVPLDRFAIDLLRMYLGRRLEMSSSGELLFVATAGGKPMKADTLGMCVRAALREVGATAADESPRLLRNTYGRRHLIEGKTNEQISSLLGLSSHRTATRLRQTLEAPDPDRTSSLDS
jgi:integrase/recombinase XerD